MKLFRNICFSFYILILLFIISNCSNNDKRKTYLQGKEIQYSFKENQDTNSYNTNNDYILCYITKDFTIIEQPVQIHELSRLGSGSNVLEIKFNNLNNSISISKFKFTWGKLFETKDFYYFPYYILSNMFTDYPEHAIDKIGLLVIYKESLKYDTLCLINEDIMSVKQVDKKLIVRTNKIILTTDWWHSLFYKISRLTKYYPHNTDEYKEYVFPRK